MKDLVRAKRILGIDINRDITKKILTLSQRSYISKVIQAFHIAEVTPITTLIGAHFKLTTSDEYVTSKDDFYMKDIPYQSAVGNLVYAMVVLELILHMELAW